MTSESQGGSEPGHDGPDMSPEAIDRRLRTVSQLHRLGQELRRARYLGKAEEPKSDLQSPRAKGWGSG